VMICEEIYKTIMLLELNIKTQKDLDKYILILDSGEYSGVTITSKKGNMDLESILKTIYDRHLEQSERSTVGGVEYQRLKITPTFSCSSKYETNSTKTFQKFLEFTSILKQFNIQDLILVSGNPKMKLDTLEALHLLENETQFYEVQPKPSKAQHKGFSRFAQNDRYIVDDSHLNIGVAYNPYSKTLEQEKQRLIAKLKYSKVNKVWLQLGQDCYKLITAVEFIRKLKPEIQITNSILMPNPKLLQSLKFRPWSGVYYTDKFYNDIKFANTNVEEMKKISRELNLEILISGV
jgi:hypothetical protein